MFRSSTRLIERMAVKHHHSRSQVKAWGKFSFPSSVYSSFSSSASVDKNRNSKQTDLRRLDVAIVGAPNAGKSQFLNTVTKTTIAAVSRKRHTTRNGILATHTEGNTQLVFIDTPGFVQSGSMRDEGMLRQLVKDASESMDRADYTLIIIDAARKIDDKLREELAMLMVSAHHSRGRIEEITVDAKGNMVEVISDDTEDRSSRERFAIVFNKVDLVEPKEKLLELAEDIGSLGDQCVRYRGEGLDADFDLNDFEETVFTPEEEAELVDQYPPVYYISALQDDGVDELLGYLMSIATPTKEFALPPNHKTDMSMNERVEEIIREKLYRCLHREVPHRIAQVNRVLEKGRLPDGRVALKVDQDLIVATKSHLKLVMGRGGMTLKRIAESSKRDLLNSLKDEGYDEVILNLHVKISRKNAYKRSLVG